MDEAQVIGPDLAEVLWLAVPVVAIVIIVLLVVRARRR
jgi:hypothetical protein